MIGKIKYLILFGTLLASFWMPVAFSAGSETVIFDKTFEQGFEGWEYTTGQGEWSLMPYDYYPVQAGEIYRLDIKAKLELGSSASYMFNTYKDSTWQSEVQYNAMEQNLPATGTWITDHITLAIPQNVHYIRPRMLGARENNVQLAYMKLTLIGKQQPSEILPENKDGIPGRVVDSSGKPFATMIHVLNDEQYFTDVETDSNGNFVIKKMPDGKRLPDGSYYLQIYPKVASQDGFKHRVDFKVMNGYLVGGPLSITMEKAQISGFVINPTFGGPADGEFGVSLFRRVKNEDQWITYLHAYAGGRFAFSGLKDGTYVVKAIPADRYLDLYEPSAGEKVTIVNGRSVKENLEIAPALKKSAQKKVTLLKAVVSQAAPKTVYVSEKGNDQTGKGTKAAPWKTISKASSVMKAGDTCIIRAGTYPETIVPKSSGTPSKRITYMAYPGEKVVITGLESVGGFVKVKDQLYATKVSWTLGNQNQIMMNGRAMWEARWPNLSTYTADGLHQAMAMVDFGTPTSIKDLALDQFGADPTGAKIWIRGGAFNDGYGAYQPQTSTVTSFDPAVQTLQIDPLYYQFDAVTPSQNNDYYLYGKLELLDAPGEWYLDPKTKKLYVYSQNGKRPTGVQMKLRSKTIDLTGVSHITIKGIQTQGGTIGMEQASNCILDGITCEWLNYTPLFDRIPELSADDGIIISGDQNMIRNSTLEQGTGTGIKITGDHNKIVNNRFNELALSAGSNAVAVSLAGDDNQILYNTIENMGRFGIQLGGRHNEIAYNDIHDFMVLSSDGGGIYGFTTDGGLTRIHHNWIHDAEGYAIGLYLDNFTRNFIADHNVFWNIDDVPLNLNTPQNFNLLLNNSFYRTVRMAGKENASWFWGSPYLDEWFRDRLINNIFVNAGKKPETNGEYIYSHNLEADTDPGYLDPLHEDFTLKEDSAARDKGIKIPGITDDGKIMTATQDAVDLGAYPFGEVPWTAGHDFSDLARGDKIFAMKDNRDIPGVDLLNNGGFEYFDVSFKNGKYQTLIDDWKPFGTTRATLERIEGGTNNWKKRGADKRLRLISGTGGVKQQITGLKPETTYELSGWVYVDEGETVTFGVKDYGGTPINVTSKAFDHFDRQILTFTTGKDRTSATITIEKVSSGPYSVYGDDFGLMEK